MRSEVFGKTVACGFEMRILIELADGIIGEDDFRDAACAFF